ncbi:MAG: hypothetical protein AAB642_01620 [Patescibacteria group bacterium]
MPTYEPKTVDGKVSISSGGRRVESDEENYVVAKLKKAGIIPADIPIAPRQGEIHKLPPTILGVHMG